MDKQRLISQDEIRVIKKIRKKALALFLMVPLAVINIYMTGYYPEEKIGCLSIS